MHVLPILKLSRYIFLISLLQKMLSPLSRLFHSHITPPWLCLEHFLICEYNKVMSIYVCVDLIDKIYDLVFKVITQICNPGTGKTARWLRVNSPRSGICLWEVGIRPDGIEKPLCRRVRLCSPVAGGWRYSGPCHTAAWDRPTAAMD